MKTLAPRAPGLSRTLILLHGYGADEDDLLPIGHLLDPRLEIVALQAPLAMHPYGRAWFELVQDEHGLSFDERQVRAGIDAAQREVEQIAARSPNPFLLGFSQGAAMALGVLLRKPALVAGVLSLSGVPPMLDEDAGARNKPVFAAHGTEDPILPVEVGRATRDELAKLGLEVEWREYRMGHMVIPEELRDASAWLRARL